MRGVAKENSINNKITKLQLDESIIRDKRSLVQVIEQADEVDRLENVITELVRELNQKEDEAKINQEQIAHLQKNNEIMAEGCKKIKKNQENLKNENFYLKRIYSELQDKNKKLEQENIKLKTKLKLTKLGIKPTKESMLGVEMLNMHKDYWKKKTSNELSKINKKAQLTKIYNEAIHAPNNSPVEKSKTQNFDKGMHQLNGIFNQKIKKTTQLGTNK